MIRVTLCICLCLFFQWHLKADVWNGVNDFYGEGSNGNNTVTECEYSGCGNSTYDYYAHNEDHSDQSYSNGNIWTKIYEVLDSNETRTFLSTFNSSYERRTIYQQLVACPFTPLCEYNLSITFSQSQYGGAPCCKSCLCDFPNCLQDQSCCLDVLFRNVNVTNKPQNNDSDSTNECVEMYLASTIRNKEEYGVVMQTCPITASEELWSNCTKRYRTGIRRFNEVTPVFDVVTLDLYRNTYCAYCHNISDQNLEDADLELTCNEPVSFFSESKVIETVMTENYCNLTFKLPYIMQPKFCSMPVSRCNITGRWVDYDLELEQACDLYGSNIEIENIIYQNVFCALCNGVQFMNQTECIYNFIYSGQSFSFSGLLKVGTSMLKHNSRISGDNNCTNNQMYDRFYDTCRDLFCSPHKILQDRQCSDFYTAVQEIIYTVFLKVTLLEARTVLMANKISDYILSAVKNLYWADGSVCGIQMIYNTDAFKDTTKINEIMNSTLKYFIIRIEINMFKYHDPNMFVEMVLSLNQLESGITYYDEQSNQMRSVNVEYRLVDLDSSMFDLISNLSRSEEFNDLYKMVEYEVPLKVIIERYAVHDETHGLKFPHLRGNDFSAKCLTDKTSINILRMKSCPMVKLSMSDTQWTYTYAGINIKHSNYYLESSEFYFEDNETIVVCSKDYENYIYLTYQNIHTSKFDVETIVSIVSSSLSVICLSVTLLVFCILSKLRKALPGKNNMSLICVLLLAQSLYLITGIGVIEARSTACVCFGVILHFLWLLSMFWMNVCTYHMFHVLTKMTVITKGSWVCRFVFYHWYAIVMSVIPVAVNIAVSISSSNSYGYGDTVCYISSQEMVMYTFGIPSAFVIVTNVCMFLYVIIKIKMAPTVQKTVKHERNNLIIFAKLSTLTGMTWIFGFIYGWTDVIVFSYLFILLNAGQGVFLMLSFICNARVINMLKSDVLGLSVTLSDTGLYKTSSQTKSNNGSKRKTQNTKL